MVITHQMLNLIQLLFMLLLSPKIKGKFGLIKNTSAPNL